MPRVIFWPPCCHALGMKDAASAQSVVRNAVLSFSIPALRVNLSVMMKVKAFGGLLSFQNVQHPL